MFFSIPTAMHDLLGAGGSFSSGMRLRSAPSRHQQRRLILEPLECRHLLSATVAADPTVSFLGDTDSEFDDLESRPLIGVDDFLSDPQYNGADGTGYAIVFLDRPFDVDHPYFGPDDDEDGISDRIVATYNAYYEWWCDETPSCTELDEEELVDVNVPSQSPNSHGSLVASIATGFYDGETGPNKYKGIAPGADIVLVQVFPNEGLGDFGAFKKGLEWVVENAVEYNIVSVNMSWSDGGNYDEEQTLYDIDGELDDLVNELGVIPVSTAGNEFYTFDSEPGVAYPGADPNALAIGATYDDHTGYQPWSSGAADYTSAPNQIASFSQRHETLMDVFAPGVIIRGASGNGGITGSGGTSFAAPQVAGMIALAQQLSVEQTGDRIPFDNMVTLLRETGIEIFDGDDNFPPGIPNGDDENDNVTNTDPVLFTQPLS